MYKNRSYLFSLVFRGYQVRKQYRPELEARQKAVPLIQAHIRGFLQRKRYTEYKEQAHESAVKIQAGKKD